MGNYLKERPQKFCLEGLKQVLVPGQNTFALPGRTGPTKAAVSRVFPAELVMYKDIRQN